MDVPGVHSTGEDGVVWVAGGKCRNYFGEEYLHVAREVQNRREETCLSHLESVGRHGVIRKTLDYTRNNPK